MVVSISLMFILQSSDGICPEHLFKCLFSICISSFMRRLSGLCLYFNWIVCVLIAVLRVLCIFGIIVFYQTCLVNIFSQSVGCLCICLTLYFAGQVSILPIHGWYLWCCI